MSRRLELAIVWLALAAAVGFAVWAFAYVPFPRLSTEKAGPPPGESR